MSKLVIKSKISKNKIANKLFPIHEKIKSREIEIKKSCSIYIDKNNNKIYSDNSYPKDSIIDLLFKINIDNQITSINIPKQKKIYLLLKGKLDEELKKLYKINEGDIIKIGECHIKILKIILPTNINNKNNIYNLNDNEKLTELKENNNNLENSLITSSQTISNKIYCKICYSTFNSLEDPLINPCKCSGSMKYIHLSCLKHWIKSKIESMNDSNAMKYSYSYSHEQLFCEICSEKYPEYIKYNNKYYNIKYNIPYKHYFLFNIIIWNNITTFVYNLDFFMSQKFISIGLSDMCDITITDVLLSDIQCVFNLKKEGIFLEDYMSKYGTYIKINKDNININFNKIKFVVDRIFFSCKIKKSFFSFGCCDLINSTLIPMSYSSQNKKEYNIEEMYSVKEIKEDEEEKIKKSKLINNEFTKESIKNDNNNNNIYSKNKNIKINSLIKSHNITNEVNNNFIFLNNINRSTQSQMNDRYNQINDLLESNENKFKIEDI